MLKSSLSANLFQSFVSTYQKFQRSDTSNIPYVYVEPDGKVKLLTNVIDVNDNNEGVFALSMAEDGWMEFLAMQD